jgi:hypothetical protein
MVDRIAGRTARVAGYSKNTPRGGLETYMPDYDDLPRGAGLSAEHIPPRRAL